MSQSEHPETAGPSNDSAENTAPAPGTGPEHGDDAAATGGKSRGFSRRRLVQGAGLAGAFGLAGFGGGMAVEHARQPADGQAAATTRLTYPFRGDRQQGVTTPAQDNMYTVAFTLAEDADAEDLRWLLEDWTSAAEQMAQGELVGGEPDADAEMPPKDTGEAWNYPPAGLTITFGFGQGIFVDGKGRDRLGLKKKMPRILAEGIPHFANEALQEKQGGGDLLVQVCSDDAQVCVHAVRNLTRIAFGTAVLKWGQIGYGRTSSTSRDQQTPRNLFGFKDGTQNIKSQDGAELLEKEVWVQEGDDPAAAWMEGGSYFLSRKIHMYLEIWDRVSLKEQQETIGRDKRYGSPLSVSDPSNDHEFDAVDYSRQGGDGKPVVPADSHVAVVAPEHNHGRRMLRRGYNYTDGNDSLGRLDAGLFFIAYTRDPRQNFYPVLKRMTEKDALTEYLQHQATALFAVPPGLRQGDTCVGQRLFE